MCVSAPVSFAASAGLALGGAAARRKSPPGLLWIASIPLIFSVQQAIEGVQWIAIHNGGASLVVGYAFLAFAFLLWPVYFPLAVYFSEKPTDRTWQHLAFLFLGLATTIELGMLLFSHPLRIVAHQAGIEYGLALPLIGWYFPPYLLAVFGSTLFSSHRFFRWFGLLLAVSGTFTFVIYSRTFISLWCLVAALLSVILFFLLPPEKKSEKRS